MENYVTSFIYQLSKRHRHLELGSLVFLFVVTILNIFIFLEICRNYHYLIHMNTLLRYLIYSIVLLIVASAQDVQTTSNQTSQPQSRPNLKAQQASSSTSDIKNVSTYQVTTFLLASLVGLAFLGVLTVLICKKKRVARCTKRMCRRNKMIGNLRLKYDVISSESITQSQFQTQCKKIIEMFSKSKQNQVFAYKAENQQQNNYCKISLTEKKQTNFHYLIELEGEDPLGEWTGEGSILCRKGQVFIWFTQEYYDISKIWAQQTRIFESTSISPEIVTGKWEKHKFHRNQSCLGVWALESAQNSTSTSVQRISTISENE